MKARSISPPPRKRLGHLFCFYPKLCYDCEPTSNLSIKINDLKRAAEPFSLQKKIDLWLIREGHLQIIYCYCNNFLYAKLCFRGWFIAKNCILVLQYEHGSVTSLPFKEIMTDQPIVVHISLRSLLRL